MISTESIDHALRPLLVKIGTIGMRVNEDQLDQYLDRLGIISSDLRQELARAGIVENPNSLQQIRSYLSQQGIETKSVSQKVLEPLSGHVDYVAEILRYRKVSKLWSMLNSFSKAVGPFDDRIRYQFRIDHQSTGRIYVTDYNLQQLPPLGRHCIIPDNNLFVVMDFKQFDLRLLAADSGDKILCSAFLNGEDPYLATAREIFDTDEVGPEHREIAKVVNLAISYGANSNGLAFNLGITKDQADEIYDRFVETHHELVSWTTSVQEEAIETGIATNRFGREFHLNLDDPEQAKRQAIAMKGQGGSADVLRRRLVMLCQADIDWKMTVHDSVVLDVGNPSQIEAAQEILTQPIEIARGEFEGQLLPLDVTVSGGSTWGMAGHSKELTDDTYGVLQL